MPHARRRGARLALLVVSVLALAGAPAPSPADRLLAALQDELSRSMAGLEQKGDPAPYFLSYLVTDTTSFRLSAAYGAIRDRETLRARLLDVEVRAGDRSLDNFHRMRGESGGSVYRRPVRLPLEDDPRAIRSALWLETDRRYREAVEKLIQIKTQQAVKVKEEDSSEDFSREEPSRWIGPETEVEPDAERWERRVREYSALLDASPEIQGSSADLIFERKTRYFVSSEGSAVREESASWRLALWATTRADDGMDLYRFENFDARELRRLPDDSAVRATIRRMVEDLLALRRAPVVEPYTGPAILEGRAAGVFFHEIFGHRIEGQRQKDEEEGQTFTRKIGQAVLPAFLSIRDDPTRERIGDVDLNGSYRYDDEGVKAQNATVVESGVLKGFLMSRSPVAGFARSNGHGRKAPGFRAAGRQANLIVESSRSVSEKRLREMLIEECRRQGKPFGLIFRDISGGFTVTGRGFPQAFQVSPILVYLVFTDGRPDELVRGVDLIGTPLASFGKILAASDRVSVFNGYCGAESGYVPVSAVSPSILTAEIEIQKRAKSPDRPPILPPPERRRAE